MLELPCNKKAWRERRQNAQDSDCGGLVRRIIFRLHDDYSFKHDRNKGKRAGRRHGRRRYQDTRTISRYALTKGHRRQMPRRTAVREAPRLFCIDPVIQSLAGGQPTIGTSLWSASCGILIESPTDNNLFEHPQIQPRISYFALKDRATSCTVPSSRLM